MPKTLSFVARARFGGAPIVGAGFDPLVVPPLSGGSARDWLRLASDSRDLAAILRNLRRGYVLKDRSDLFGIEGDDRDPLDVLLDAVSLHPVYGKGQAVSAEEYPEDGGSIADGVPGPEGDPDSSCSAGDRQDMPVHGPKVHGDDDEIDAEDAEGGDLEEASVSTAPIPVGWQRRQAGSVVPVHLGYLAISLLAARSGMRPGDGVSGHVFAEDVTGLAEWVSLNRAVSNFSKCFWDYRTDKERGLYLVGTGA
jgi:hypothetical protein